MESAGSPAAADEDLSPLDDARTRGAGGGARDSVRGMRRDLRARLIVPTALAMSSFGAACGDDKPSTTSTTGGQTETSAATEVSTSGGTETGQPTTGGTGEGSTTTDGTTIATGSEDTGSEGTGGELPDCGVFADMAACQAMAGCAWDFEAELCIVDCTMIHDEATCNKAMICFWADMVCYPPI